MESNEVTKMANQIAMVVKKAKKNKKTQNVFIPIEQAEEAAKACAVLGRIVKLSEADAEISAPDARLTGADAGRAEVWRLITQELDSLDK